MLPLTKMVRKTDKLPEVILALAAMLKASRLFPIDVFGTAISRFQRTAVVETSLEALKTGAELIDN